MNGDVHREADAEVPPRPAGEDERRQQLARALMRFIYGTMSINASLDGMAESTMVTMLIGQEAELRRLRERVEQLEAAQPKDRGSHMWLRRS